MPRALLGLSTVLLCGAIAACAVAPASDSASEAGGDAPAAASSAPGQAHAPAPARPPRPALRAPRPAVPLTDPDTPPALREPAPAMPSPSPAPETEPEEAKGAKDGRASGLGLDLGSELGDFGEEGMASWYGARFHARRTASGERFDMNDFTAAHRTLPFGTRVCVRSLVTGRAVQVRINDRGPHSQNRILDLSRAAAQSLGLLGLGIKPVAITLAPTDPDVPCPGADSMRASGD